jgi:hypothetical protein
MDAFEREFGSTPFLRLPGATFIGACGALGFIQRHETGVLAIVGPAASFAAGASWVFLAGRFARWLITRRTWPSPARRLLWASVVLGIPLLALAVVQAVLVGS